VKSAIRLSVLATLATTLTVSAASAHIGQGDSHDALHGFLHPLTGADHALAMLSIGFLAAQWGGRAIWLIPSSFLAVMAIGGAVGMAGVRPPGVEFGVALSVVALGALIACRARLSLLAAMGLAGLFALFHGLAHGAELPAGASGVRFALGFVLATALLHAGGVVVGWAAPRAGATVASGARWAGTSVAFAGVGLVVASL
jgi:urease accessory protein